MSYKGSVNNRALSAYNSGSFEDSARLFFDVSNTTTDAELKNKADYYLASSFQRLNLPFTAFVYFTPIVQAGPQHPYHLKAVEALVRQLRPQLLLLDLGLPGLHGVDIASAIKAEFAESVKVLVLTGDLQANSVRQALAAGADGYVHKSEDSAELLQAVHAVLAGRQYVSSNIAAAFLPRVARADGTGDVLVATPREREIMSLVARGLSNREIAELLAISVLTVRTHRQNLMEKFSLRNAAEITAYAVQRGYYMPS